MWPRSIEVMLGVWLALSPWIFGHFGRQPLTASDLLSGLAVVVLASASFFPRLRRAHFGILPVVAWLVGHGYFGYSHPIPPGAQNEILTGLTLLLVAIIPDEASKPPRKWRELLEAKAREGGHEYRQGTPGGPAGAA